MATAAEASTTLDPPLGRIFLPVDGWADYERMLRIVGDRHIHVTYDHGMLEVRVPSQRHEQAAQLLGFFIPQLAEELELDFEPLGMTTWKRPDLEKGLEADQCYYFANEAVVREKAELDLEVDPPPDLAIEVDITTSSINRMSIYAELGVPEVWRYDGVRLTIHQLGPDRRYQSIASRLSIPALTPADVERLIESGRVTAKRQWAKEIRAWARSELLPRVRMGGR
jgi:Uma2 family endonuclease